MDMTTSKSAQRNRARSIDRSVHSDAVNNQLVDWRPLHGTVLSYLAMPDEVDLAQVNALSRCRVVVTRTPETGPLTVHELNSSNLETHRLGFEQPTAGSPEISLDEIDVVLVPGMMFDPRGGRLGRGGGYYDALLSQLPRGVIRVGITVDDLIVSEVPREPHDERVGWIATESGVHRAGEPLPDATQRFVERAVRLGVAPDIHRFPDGTKTSADAARAVGAPLGTIAKSILFEVDGDPILVIASGDTRVSEGKLAEWAGGTTCRIASLSTVRDVTGFVAGGTPGMGLDESTEVVADRGLARYRWVWSAGGTPDTVYPIALDRLIAASGARWAEVADRGNK